MSPQDWLPKFSSYYQEAINAGSFDPTAVRLATCSHAGLPSCRMVLLKGFDEKGLTIYTNFESRKGRELTENPQAALYFYWPKIGKEIEIEGKVEFLSEEESNQYFATRSFFSQVGAHASRQSRPMFDVIAFHLRIAYYTLKYFLKEDVARPKYWRGFRIVPNKVNFIEH